MRFSTIGAIGTLLSPQGSVLEASESAARCAGKRVALYFSAGWCPMCTSFEPSLLSYRSSATTSPVELIYVPSDRNAADGAMRAAVLDMLQVGSDDAAALKAKYGVWAGAEVGKFGVSGRRSGVPAIIALGPADGEELAFIDAERSGRAALVGWDGVAVWPEF